MIGAAGDVTVTVAEPKRLPLVARTVLLNVPIVPPAVNKPVLASIVPPPFTTDHTGVIATTLPPASLPTAVNCCCVLIPSVTGFGVTVIVASGPGVTIAVAVPKMDPLVALTVFGNVPAVVPAVNNPVAALMVPPPAVTDHTGVIATTFPFASRPTAVYCWVPLIGIVPGFGVTVIVASGPATTVTVAEADIPRQVATTVLLVPATVPAVKTPVLGSIEPPPVTDQTIAPGFGVTLAPVKSVPTAVN
jgi:hypothetical protein